MKTSLSHLPEQKQFEINRILEVIKEVVNPEMVILFGSHAKGTFVEHRYVSKGITYEYGVLSLLWDMILFVAMETVGSLSMQQAKN